MLKLWSQGSPALYVSDEDVKSLNGERKTYGTYLKCTVDFTIFDYKNIHMEPVTTSAMIGTIVGYLAKMLKDNKSIKRFMTDFTDSAVSWIRPLFLVDEDKPKEILENLSKNPDSEARQNAVKNALEIALEDAPDAVTHIKEMYDLIKGKEAKGESIQIHNTASIGNNSSNNIVIQGINSEGNTSISIDKSDKEENK